MWTKQIINYVNAPWWPFVSNLVIFVPDVGTLCNSYMMSQQFHLKYALLNSTQASLVSEIYRFRCRVGAYATSGAVRKPAKELNEDLMLATNESEDNDNAAVIGKHTRSLFS